MRTTFPRLLLEHAAKRPQAPAMREKEYGIWQTTSWHDMAQRVRHIAGGLHQLGLRRGEHLIVIGANRPSLYATMLATQALGAIPVPLYQDAVAAECVFPINNAEVRFVVVEDQEQVDKMLEIRPQCPQLEHILFDDPRGLFQRPDPGDAVQFGGAQRARPLPQSIGLAHGGPSNSRCGVAILRPRSPAPEST
jgi:long-chain acyl-CoA synthetase